jgi:hypothetical protein
MLSLHLLQDFSPQFFHVWVLLHRTPSKSPRKSSRSECQITAFPYWPGPPQFSIHLSNKTQQLNETQICAD